LEIEMNDLVERVARAIEQSEEIMAERESDSEMRLPDGNNDARYLAMARAAIDATGYATLEAALRAIQEAIPKYVHPEPKLSAEEFAFICVGAVDNAKVNKALEGKK
jgi:hypothetical protein